ncbi:MAG TPA: DUF6544 family protein [Chroococcales cyanobacterium]
MKQSKGSRFLWMAGLAAILPLSLTGCASLHASFSREVSFIGLPQGPSVGAPITEADLAPLPKPVQRYLRFMGVLGKPRDWSFRGAFTGRFRTGLNSGWMDIEAWQYNTRLDLARVFHMRGNMNGLPVLARDTYVHGKGRMLAKVLDLFTVADGQGTEYDIGELVTYLNDAILMAPSLILGPETAWAFVDENSFDVSLTNGERTVKARVFLDEEGAPMNFSTTDRFCEDPYDPKHPLIRGHWTTPMEGWQKIGGRSLPTRGKAIWQFPQGPYTYADFNIASGSLQFNLPPGQ